MATNPFVELSVEVASGESDPTGVTLTIVEDATGAVVASSVAATKTTATGVNPSTWKYEYTFATTKNYTLTWTVTFADASTESVITRVRSLVSRRSLLYLRRAVSAELGGFGLFTTSQASANDSIIHSNDLVWAEKSSSSFDNTWQYAYGGNISGQQRPTLDSGYSPTAGTLQVARPWSDEPDAGVEIEIHAKLPAIQAGRVDGLREVINRALSKLWINTREALPTSESEFFDLSDKDWLTHRSQIIDVYRPSDPTNNAYRPYRVGYAYRFVPLANETRLEGPMVSETGWEIEVQRPADTFIKASGAWGDSQVGLVDDTDEQFHQPQVVIPVALYEAYKALSKAAWLGQDERDKWLQMALQWAPVASNVKQNYMDLPDLSPGNQAEKYAHHWGTKGLFL